MIVARWGMLLVSAVLVLAAFGATAPDTSPSALRLTVTAVVGLLAPLFWPGQAATPAGTLLRVVGWSAAAAALAVLLIRALGTPAQTLPRLLASGAMLLAVLLLAHGAAAVLEGWWRGHASGAEGAPGTDTAVTANAAHAADTAHTAHTAHTTDRADSAREAAGRSVALALTLLGALPLWLGPVAEWLSPGHEGLVDAVLGASPLTHLAVASENDLLRNEWLYQHANLSGLQANDPALAHVAWAYAALGLALTLAALAFRPRRGPTPAAAPDIAAPAPRLPSTPENPPS